MTADQIRRATPDERFAHYMRLSAARDDANAKLADLQKEVFQTGVGNHEEINDASVQASAARKALSAYVRELCTLIGGATV